jgi:ribosomal protein S18 acetylase RimI-like enzyme
VRVYELADRQALYDICLRTGANGDDATGLYSSPSLLGEVYVGPYVEFAPNYAWVVDIDGSVAGYVLGVADTAAFQRTCERLWWPTLRERYPLGSFPSGSEDDNVVRLIHDPPVAPIALLHDYPAHLHIDLLPEAQGLRLGGALIGTLLEALTADGVPGIHLGVSTANARAVGFYVHLGFEEIERSADGLTLGMHLGRNR